MSGLNGAFGALCVLGASAGIIVAQGPNAGSGGVSTPGEAPERLLAAVVIDFDALSDGDIVTNQFPEATFTSSVGSNNKITAQSLGSSLPNFLCTGPIGSGINCVEPTFIDFTDPVTDLTLLGIGIDAAGSVAEIDVFVGGSFASTVDVIGVATPLTPVVVDLSSFGNVTRIEIVNITDPLGIGWDDFSFNVEVVACSTLDFETEDDFSTPLVNGQHINTEFGNLVVLTSSGPNAGIGIFDSTPGGPNDPSQDRDLLVDSGNILILQTENFAPDGSDVFPRPNDDEDGGMITFQLNEPMEASSVKLIDVDATDNAHFVVLTDSSARQRTYTVPPSWTGDVLVAGPGSGVLDLLSLAPQPGFGSVATATEDAGFDASSLVRIDLDLNGSVGIDDLALCLPGMARASAHVRAGSGINPMNLTPTSMPVIGQTWTANLDCSALGPGTALLVVRHSPSTGSMTPFGEVLIRGVMMHQDLRPQAGTVRQLSWDIPSALALIGTEAYAQGLCMGSLVAPGFRSLQVKGRLSNAVDLTLGF